MMMNKILKLCLSDVLAKSASCAYIDHHWRKVISHLSHHHLQFQHREWFEWQAISAVMPVACSTMVE